MPSFYHPHLFVEGNITTVFTLKSHLPSPVIHLGTSSPESLSLSEMGLGLSRLHQEALPWAEMGWSGQKVCWTQHIHTTLTMDASKNFNRELWIWVHHPFMKRERRRLGRQNRGLIIKRKRKQDYLKELLITFPLNQIAFPLGKRMHWCEIQAIAP